MHAQPVTAFVGLGANLGDAKATVLQAIETLAHWPAIEVKARSRLYSSAPHEAHGPDFVNAAVRLDTRLSAPALLQVLQAIEAAAGRQRPYKHAPRTLDLDLLLYGQAHIQSATLTVPHPRWRQRAFVLLPLAEVAPEWVSELDLQAVAEQVIVLI